MHTERTRLAAISGRESGGGIDVEVRTLLMLCRGKLRGDVGIVMANLPPPDRADQSSNGNPLYIVFCTVLNGLHHATIRSASAPSSTSRTAFSSEEVSPAQSLTISSAWFLGS